METEDLEREGYAVTVFNFEAAAVGAKHRRERIFFVAYTNSKRLQGWENTREECRDRKKSINQQFSRCDTLFGNYWSVEPDVGRVANGIPNRVDRLKCLGNAVVPQQVYPILQAIAEIETR